jgi:hypothetical protein
MVGSSLQAAPDKFLSDLPNGVLFYLFYTTIAFMGFPVILPLDYYKNYQMADRKYLIFIGLSLLVTIATVVVLIYMAEGGSYREVQRVHLRYLFPLVIPMLIYLFKIDFTKLKLGLPGALSALFLLLYELILHPKFKSGSIIDAKSLLLVERLYTGTPNGFSLLFLLATLFSAYVGYLLYKKMAGEKARKIIILTLLAVLLANQTYATYKSYRYYTVQTSGIERRTEYSVMGNLIASRPGTPIILFSFPTIWFDVLLSTQTSRDFTRADFVETVLEYAYDPAYPPNYIITPKDLLRNAQVRGASKLDLNLTMFDMYQVDEPPDGLVRLNYYVTGVYPDGWLKEGAKLYVSGAGKGDQTNISIGLKTSALIDTMEAVLTDGTGSVTTAVLSPQGTTLNLLIKKQPDQKDFVLTMSARQAFVPAELPEIFGDNQDERQLTYSVTQITIP